MTHYRDSGIKDTSHRTKNLHSSLEFERGLPPLARRCGLGQSAQRRTALNRPCAPLSLHAPADTAGGRTEA